MPAIRPRRVLATLIRLPSNRFSISTDSISTTQRLCIFALVTPKRSTPTTRTRHLQRDRFIVAPGARLNQGASDRYRIGVRIGFVRFHANEKVVAFIARSHSIGSFVTAGVGACCPFAHGCVIGE